MIRRSAAIGTTAATGPAGMGEDFAALEIGRLTWIGLALAALGWAMILGETTVSAILFLRTGRAAPPAFHADLLEIGKCVIASGFGLAVVGALQTGFGTLNRFFGAVLLRSGRRDGVSPPAAAQPVSRPIEPVMDRPVERSAPASIKRRPYRMFPDGTVEVETILGTRLFSTMAEARDFI